MLSDRAKDLLRRIVRQSLAAAVTGEPHEPADPELPELAVPCGCFVTFKTGGKLRGCIGCFTVETPLWRTVAQYAEIAATQDPRFVGNRLQSSELPLVEFDVSVLSPLEKTDRPAEIELGKHGIYVRSGMRSGCFLPQVAEETGWDIEQFWGNCCAHKAGLPADAWKDPDIETFVFTAEIVEGRYAG